jgi:hypothetical protein
MIPACLHYYAVRSVLRGLANALLETSASVLDRPLRRNGRYELFVVITLVFFTAFTGVTTSVSSSSDLPALKIATA